jgi:hypothetical protein
VTTLPLRTPFHRFDDAACFKSSVTLHVVMAALPLLAMLTSAQYPEPQLLVRTSVASPEPEASCDTICPASSPASVPATAQPNKQHPATKARAILMV